MKILILLIVLFTVNINAKIIYVDGEGYSSENNDGTSWDNALGFITDALDSAKIGDEIWILNNYYYIPSELYSPYILDGNIDYQLYGGFEGTETNIKERKDPNNTEIDGVNDYYYYKGFDVYYLLEQYNNSDSPFLGSVDSVWNKKNNNLLIDGFRFIGFDSPVIVFSGKKMIIENCDFKYNIGLGTSAILANCDSVIIKNCKIFNNYAYLIPSAGTNSKYYGNCIRLLNKSNQYIKIENSVIVNIDPAMNIQPNTQIEIVNSLIGAVNSDTLSNYYSDNPVFVIEDGANETNVNVISKNNIFIGDVDTLIRKLSKNCIFTSYLNYSNYIQKIDFQDSFYFDSTYFDFHPVANSPAINGGILDSTIEKIEYDLDGNPRVYDATIDIGPYEYQQKDTVNNKPVLYDISKTMKYPQDSSIQFSLNLINDDSTTKVLFLNSPTYGSIEYLGDNIVKYTTNSISTSKTESINIKVIDTQNDTSNQALISIDIIKKDGILTMPTIFNNADYSIIAYPNPAIKTIIIKASSLNSVSKKHVKIYDIFGTLKENTTIDNSKRVDVSNYPKGIYFVELYQNNKLQARTKFVKVDMK